MISKQEFCELFNGAPAEVQERVIELLLQDAQERKNARDHQRKDGKKNER